MRFAAVMAGLLLSGAAFAQAPQVVEAVPDHGDWNVDPAVAELRLVFDQDMGKGASWVGGGYCVTHAW